MESRADKIILADDAEMDLRVHAATLRGKGYEVQTCRTGQETLDLAQTVTPELFLIASRMKGMDGYALCEQLKQQSRLAKVPVIFVTPRPTPDDIERSYAAGGADYIAKPCNLTEFLARVSAQIRSYHLLLEVEQLRELAMDANPLTHLPGNNTISTAIQRAVDAKADVTVIYADLDNFKAYNDTYGFSNGDDLLLFTAETLQTSIRMNCPENSFLGHVGGDDFVLIVASSHAETLGADIVRRFDKGAPAFYNEIDRARGHIESCDRLGRLACFPLVSISLGGVTLRAHDFSHVLEVVGVCAEVKHAAKAIQGSVLFMDRRAVPEPAPGPVVNQAS